LDLTVYRHIGVKTLSGLANTMWRRIGEKKSKNGLNMGRFAC